MDLVRTVYLVYNPRIYDEWKVREELKQEGYPHNFFITAGGSPVKLSYLNEADEVWCFGPCEESPDYKKAVEVGKEIWIMG